MRTIIYLYLSEFVIIQCIKKNRRKWSELHTTIQQHIRQSNQKSFQLNLTFFIFNRMRIV